MIPLHDDNPTRRRPYVKYSLLLACALVFGWQQLTADAAAQAAVYAYGFIPAVFFGDARLPDALAAPPSVLTPLTSMFLHGGWMHFIGNMAFLYVFGDNVEDAMSRWRFVLFYAVCGAAAALAQAAMDWDSRIPMIGASGAIAGLLGAYLLLYPRARVLTLIPLGPLFFWKRLPAMLLLIFWFGLQFVQGWLQPAGGGGVAHAAHIGGFVAGMALIGLFKRRDVPFFAQAVAAPTPAATPATRIPRIRDSWRKP